MINQDFRRFAPYGLYLAALALLASAVAYVIEQSFALPVQVSLAVVVLGVAVWVLLDPQKAKEAFTGRQARYGSNALVLTLAFLGILIVINYLVFQNSRRWDLTEDQKNTLTPETVQALESIQTPVLAEAYYSSSFPIGSTRDTLENYKLNSKGKFDYEVIDPVQNPVRAKEANITRDGTIVLRSEDRMEQVTFSSEQEITGALVRLNNPGERAVYFLVGHGEYGIEAGAEQSYNSIKQALAAKNYTINTLNLIANPQVPDNALSVIVPGPKKPLSQQEVDALDAYLGQGGSLVYLSDPRPTTDFGDLPDPMAAYLEESWGIRLEEDVVIDLNNPQQPLVAVASNFGKHPVTEKMYTSAALLPVARGVQALAPSPEITLTTLASTTENAWGETDYQSLSSQQVTPDQDKDVMGPISLAVAGVNNINQARVIVIGDSDFASDENFAAYGNSDLLLNSIDWAAEQENLISLSPKQNTERLLVIPDRTTMGLILFSSIFLLPGIVILTGIFVWIQRRQRG
jgi:ABC-type uncharacterized transport system involved in gliding motility auxiliary subunit